MLELCQHRPGFGQNSVEKNLLILMLNSKTFRRLNC